jgi:hypothetical protein
MNEFKLETTVRDIMDAHGAVGFYRELIDTVSLKCYGTQELTQAEIDFSTERAVGFYGAMRRTFTCDFEIQRGHRIVVIRCSEKKPVVCVEHIFPHV